MSLSVGIDVGGTNTDFIILNHKEKSIYMFKCRSTPKSPHQAVLQGIKDTKIDLSKVFFFVHGTTTCTNTIVERKGAKAGLITNKGFKDILEIMRIARAYSYKDLYNLQWRKPEPLIPRYLRAEVNERIDYTGKPLSIFTEEEVVTICEFFKKQGVESIAVSLLFSYLNPKNELRIEQIIKNRYPEIFVSVSSRYPLMGEYERTSTAAADAYVKPVMDHYLTQLGKLLKKNGLSVPCYIMKSNGGIISSTIAKDNPLEIFLSGPAGGAIFAKYISEVTNNLNVIACDMGGTSFDVTLIAEGVYSYSKQQYLYPGIPIRVPMIDLVTIGAGGGSIAWVDAGGALKVGPQSAGADPGPACYNQGGTEPTVTDANLVLGRLNPEYFLGGKMAITYELAYKSIKTNIADKLHLGVEETAQHIIDVVVANMAQAIRMVSVERGYDPRDFTLVAFGGAGPLHTPLIADVLQIPKILIPIYPGATSAMGLLMADLRFDFVRSYPSRLENLDINEMQEVFSEMNDREKSLLKEQQYRKEPQILNSIDMRYEGQNYEIDVPFNAAFDVNDLKTKFDERHKQLYGFSSPDVFHEIINLRSTIIGKIRGIDLTRKGNGRKQDPFKGTREVFFSEHGGFIESNIYERDYLQPDFEIKGPAIIEELDSTILIPSHYKATIDNLNNVILFPRR